MSGRLPTAILLAAGLLSAVASASEPARPSIGSITLSGGFSIRNSTFLAGGEQAQSTRLMGVSPWLVRLRGDWFPLTWIGVEGEGSGDFFQATNRASSVRLDRSSQGGAGRLGVTLRHHSASGFIISGALGYGFSWSPFIRITTVGGDATPASIFSNGPAARLGLGYSGERFQGIAGATAMYALGGHVSCLEPQLWLAGRVAEVGPAAFWVGLDGAALFETMANSYSGTTIRLAIALKVELLPPAPKPLVGPGTGATTLQLQVKLPDGTPASGALVALDGAAPVAVDEKGQLTLESKPGTHTATATLAGHRPAKATAEVLEGRQTPVLLELTALTGPGRLSGVVRASATAKPVPEATVTAEGAPPVQTGADGTYKFDALGPGPVKVRVDAQGFTSADEIAQVPPESAATLDVQLEALGKGSPATVRGLIRSRTGEALKASVVIKGLATKVEVTPEGRFFVTVPGGTYQFVISAPGYLTQTKKVVLADGDQAIVHTELQKASK